MTKPRLVDQQIARRVRERDGVVLTSEVEGSPSHRHRSARRRNLVPVLRGTWVAETQPVTADVVVAALRATNSGSVVLGLGALWLYGLASTPTTVTLGVEHSPKRSSTPPIAVVRVTARVLAGARRVQGVRVASLEVAVVQAATELSKVELVRLLATVLRDRRTTSARLHATFGRGFAGSAAVREALRELSGGSLEREVRRLQTCLAARGVHGLVAERKFVNSEGAACYADLYDEASQTVMEVDGYLNHSERGRFRADRRRDRWMSSEHELLTLRIDAQEIQEDLERLADELAACILKRRRSRVAGR